MAVPLAHLLKWQHQPEPRGRRWEASIRHQRQRLCRRLEKTPSLKPDLYDPEGRGGVCT
jgi:GTP-dependent phosphoenolpyruvate carboxykinase